LRIIGGESIQNLQVITHRAKVQNQGAIALVELDAQDAIPNKDFVVRYQLASERPAVSLLAQRDQRGGHFLLMIQPKAKMTLADVALREYVFVLDVSGSMEGLPLNRSRALVKRCLGSLGSRDTFQMVQFEAGVATFAPQAVSATASNLQSGLSWLEHLQGGGGTEFIPALKVALNAPKDPARSRIVVFLTDGYIGNENEVLKYLRDHAQGTNIFALGVGSSVNRFLIDGMARIGVGRPFYLTNAEKPDAVAERLFSVISRPSLTQIRIDYNGLDVQGLNPRVVPDLFGDQPVFVAGRFSRGGPRVLTVRGLLAGQPFSQTVKVDLPTQDTTMNEAVPYLWARRQIADWSDLAIVEPEKSTEMEKQITEVALRYNLMSRYTSMVAVDVMVRNQGGKQGTVNVPVPLPDGVSPSAAPPSAYVGTASDGLTGEAYGMGGLGLMGTGHGGGGMGTAAMGHGSVSTIGRGAGGGSGVGYGSGAGRLGLRGPASSPRVEMGSVTVRGSLDKEIIRRVIRQHLKEVRTCYKMALAKAPGLSGRVVIRFIFSATTGLVLESKVVSSTVSNVDLEQCIAQAVRRWQFPKIVGGGIVTVVYPFVLTPGK
jgi:Ca-activated chloride channel homolog